MKNWLNTLGSAKTAATARAPEANIGRSLELKHEGNLCMERGDLEGAVDRYGQAVQVNPRHAEAHCNLGIALKILNRLDAAAGALQAALALNPELDRAHYHLGTLHALHGHYALAATHLGRAIEIDPTFTSCYHDLSVLHYVNGRHDLAQQVIARGLAVAPDDASLHLSHGNLRIATGDVAEGLAAYRSCLALAAQSNEGFGPTFQMAQVNVYLVLRARGDMAAADACLADLLAKEPDDPTALNKIGEIHLLRGQPDLARHFLLRAYDRLPLDHDVLNNLGLAEQRCGNLASGMDLLRRAADVRPNWAPPILNLGKAHEATGELTQAGTHYKRALQIDPSLAEATYRYGLLRLLSGEFRDGWNDYEARWQMPHMQSDRRELPAPLWLGQQPLFGKSILIHAEQGLGDTIHAVRFLEQLATTGAVIYMEVQPALRALCARMPSAPFARKIISRGDPLPAVDFQCPLMSLPLALKVRDFVGLPGRKPYLRAAEDRQQQAAAALVPWRNRVGVAWSDDQAGAHGVDRSIPLAQMAALLQVQGAEFFLLQDPLESEHEALMAAPNIHLSPAPARNLDEIAATIANLDLVIAADSTIAHLSAAMGKPTWIIIGASPDWRWMLERSDSPWYPSVKVYRQAAGQDWSPVLTRAAGDLAAFFAATR